MKNYVIIGGTRGIGKHIADLLIGANVYIVARSGNEITDGNNLHFIQADTTENIAALPGLPEVIDGLVYCPGTINLKPFHRLTEEDFLNDWKINFLGAVKVIQLLLPHLKRSNQASIVLFSTVAVKTGMAFHASVASSKAAIEGLTTALAAEFAPNIRVNCIAPSLTQTSLTEKLTNTPEKIEAGNKRHPLQRIGQPSDIAELAGFLLSEKAGWITGQVMHVDGGMSTLKV
jgi:NAD(P)-dependent dehydrogenase (short-subunit alcohol dehydrogenase family)